MKQYIADFVTLSINSSVLDLCIILEYPLQLDNVLNMLSNLDYK